MNGTRKEKGFTIIEVVLVLAIAGLIFLMVFIALPALQRNQRDTARKNDMSIIASAISSAKSANRGSFPSQETLRQYVTNLSDNTSAAGVTRVTDGAGPRTVTQEQMDAGTVFWQSGRKCGAVGPNGSVTIENGSLAQFVVYGRLENGTSGYCVES